MKNSFHSVIVLVVGMAVGICLSLLFNYRTERQQIVQRDTVEVVKTIRYSYPELTTIRLDIPSVGIPEYIFIPEEKIKIEYRDSIGYIALQRERFYTQTNEAEIWHSGIESRIDSLALTQKNVIITETITEKPWRHTVTAYGEIGYMEGLKATAGIKYLYHPNKWLGLGGSIERDFLAKQTGIYANIDMTLGW